MVKVLFPRISDPGQHVYVTHTDLADTVIGNDIWTSKIEFDGHCFYSHTSGESGMDRVALLNARVEHDRLIYAEHDIDFDIGKCKQFTH